MLNQINIIDGDKHITAYLKGNNVFVYSDSYPLNINFYFNLLKTDNVYDFYKSGYSSILYKGNGKENDKKRFHFGKIVIVISLATLLALNSIGSSDLKAYYINSVQFSVPDYTVNDLRDMLYSSIYLSDEEKNFLYNEDLFNDIVQTINDYNYIKYMYTNYFDNIRIISYEEPPSNIVNAMGYYTPDNPSTLFVSHYEELDQYKKDTVAHEFIHLCQASYGYNLITEACAEIISNEYYNVAASCYSSQIKLVKTLMEIIGSEPIWVYNFTGDFSLIEENVKPYLTDEEYIEFLDDLSFDRDDYNLNRPKFNSLEGLLSKIYTQKFNQDINDNKVISLINSYDRTISRYYFNKKYINEENSFYLNYDEGSYQNVSLEEAMKLELIQLYSHKETPLDPETAINLANEGNYSVVRKIDYSSADIIINRSTFQNSKMIFSGYVNKVEYEDCDIDDLVLKGIIKIDYTLIDMKLLSAKEYLNHEYPDDVEIKVYKKSDTEFNESDGTVYGFVPRKDYLPLTNEINNNKELKLD